MVHTDRNGSDADEDFMRLAIAQAQEAQARGEVPVGALVVKNGQVIATGGNAPRMDNDPTAHAEIVAIRKAAKVLGNYRLDGCTLYVTLEPCSMCVGAMLHARLARVVFGAHDPKTGAAGSVVDLFSSPQLNHQTLAQGGVLAADCAQLLRTFFRKRREVEQALAQPLRDDALRTPDICFDVGTTKLFEGNYTQALPSLAGLRMHWIDEGPRDAQRVILCLHGVGSWGHAFSEMIPVWVQMGHRVVVPDLIGFGRSDKPKRQSFHTVEFHSNSLRELVESLDLKNIVLLVQDWVACIGLTLPRMSPDRYREILVLDALTSLLSGVQQTADSAPQIPGGIHAVPFPDAGYLAAVRAFPVMLGDFASRSNDGLAKETLDFLQTSWSGKCGRAQPVNGRDVHSISAGLLWQQLMQEIRGSRPPRALDVSAELGRELANQLNEFFSSR